MNLITLLKLKVMTIIVTVSSALYAANEAALYELAPADSAYVRLINSADATPISTHIGKHTITSPGFCKASDFIFTAKGHYTLDIAGQKWEGNLQADTAYTFIYNNEQLNIIKDTLFTNRKKGLFTAYNLSDKAVLDIKTADGDKAIFTAVGRNDKMSREVNPIRIDLAVYETDSKLIDTDTARFQRGKSSHLFICGNNNQYLATWSVQ